MQIDFELSGGYGGLFAARPKRLRLVTEGLPDATRRDLEALVQSSGILELPADVAMPDPAGARDVFRYRIAVQTDRGTRTVETSDAAATEAMRPLLGALTRYALGQHEP